MTVPREWFEKDYYAVLGVSQDASHKDITKAYRKLARQLHPDASGGDEARFKEVSAAYAVVGEEAKRKEYDEARRLGDPGFAHSGFAGGPGGFQVHVEDLGDLFSGLFGRGGRSAGGRGGFGAAPMRGIDQEAELHLGFRDAVEGITTTVRLYTEHLGPNGVERSPRDVKVRIPAGVADGQRIRLRGKGGPGRNGGPPGDLFVKVHVAPDDTFGRSGARDLTITVPITFPEAALGANVTVPTFDSSTVTLKVPAGTPSGKTFRVKGRGVAGPSATGDLLVTVEIVVPTRPSKAEREAIEALAAVTDWSPRSERAEV